MGVSFAPRSRRGVYQRAIQGRPAMELLKAGLSYGFFLAKHPDRVAQALAYSNAAQAARKARDGRVAVLARRTAPLNAKVERPTDGYDGGDKRRACSPNGGRRMKSSSS